MSFQQLTHLKNQRTIFLIVITSYLDKANEVMSFGMASLELCGHNFRPLESNINYRL